MPEILASQWRKKIAFVGQQTRQMLDKDRPFVRCACLKKLSPHNAYKCLYCGEYYCKKCAEEHFGKTVNQYRQENPIVDDPKPLCSGFKVFPDGRKCDGCDDCQESS